MRLVFVLYAEDRGLLSSDPVYQEHYSAGRLFERLRDDHARHPDTMDSRYGAWAQLLTLFRLIHDGAAHGRLRLPARHGRLFNPDTWDFLEGRPHEDILDRQKRIDPPRVSDGVLHRVLENLLVLDGERISYRALDVEQIGSVYEAMMGFELRLASGPSVALKPHHVTVDLDGLLKAKPADRLKQLEEEASCKVSGKTAEAVKSAATVEALLAALQTRISPFTPRPIGKGGLILQPTDERRQYEVLKALCGEEHRNVMLVADADQSIYRFAGASDRFLKAFLRDFGAQKRGLSESFRCGEAIVKVALALIAKNPDRLSAEHTMTSVARAPAYVTAASYADEAEEARAVADILAGLLQQGLAAAWLHPEEEPRVEPEDLCVLGRSRYVLDSVVGELRAREIPLAFRSGLGELFESRGYRLVYNALRVVHNERDLPAPASLLAQLEGVAVDPDAQLNDVLRSVEGADDPSTAPFAGPLLRLVEGPPSVETLVQALSGVAPPPQVTDDEREVLERDAQAFRDRWGQYSRSNKDPELGGFLAELALAGRTAIDEKGVRMLTVHAAKGLEFRAVVIVGMNQGSFPDFRGLEGQGLVDERRNAYVAVTRAERRLHLSRPRTRRMPWGDSRTQQPSRFLQEMGVTMVDV